MTVAKLKAAIAALGAVKKSRRFSRELRSVIAAFARQRTSAGVSAAAVCRCPYVGAHPDLSVDGA